uniref:Uncharacterized protein n=1 Tax=Glossina austeni TaxID=7395 RepID=A0A1A9VEF3_GLOAU
MRTEVIALALSYASRGNKIESTFKTQAALHMLSVKLQQQQQQQQRRQQQQQQQQQQHAVHTRSLGEEDQKAINYRKMQAQVKTKLGSISTRMPSKAINVTLQDSHQGFKFNTVSSLQIGIMTRPHCVSHLETTRCPSWITNKQKVD